MQQALDFQNESDALYDLLKPLGEEDFERKTLFKDWTINDILQHLHIFNYAAYLSLTDEDAILKFLADLKAGREVGETLLTFTDKRLNGLKGRALLAEWRDYYTGMVPAFRDADPKKRLKWAGPDMSVLSSITARLMETWSHAQAIYDLLGVARQEQDHVKNVVVIGNNTFGWTFVNRGEEVPEDKPCLRLTAPSGEVWEFNEPSEDNCIEGSAAEFSQVVTQTRNIADTDLTVVGETATKWMAVAQCFAGPPQDPPAAGTRHIQT
ncbi:MAG: TIGR03084 family metal-binding protein [Alphaproteobacteria bacterium]|nr:TIGR03084 family metal-binding protein [Alphaproteobacteria bacterium]MDP6813445.1 TIGR03084 family metal-binding protein [Alphaproteobacteria bacterium]